MKRIAELLSVAPSAIAYEVGAFLASQAKAVIESEAGAFSVAPFAAAGLCTMKPKRDVHQQVQRWFNETEGVQKSGEIVWLEVGWQGKSFEVVRLVWFGSGVGWTTRSWIMAESEVAAEAFFEAVCRHNSELRDEVLVFEGGYWCKSEELFRGVQGAKLEGLVPALKESLTSDAVSFFAAKSIYEEHGVPWKRGLLFAGPPGNGKTLAIKSLVNHLKKPCLYVKSLDAKYSTEHRQIRSVFARARDTAPCVLVLEDLDSIITA